MSKLQVSAMMNIREGKLEEFKQQVSECIKQSREKDTGTLRYDWFLNRDETKCEIREEYVSSKALEEHRANLKEVLNKLFREYASDHKVVVFGDPSPELIELAKISGMMDRMKWYSFLQGLE